MIEIGLAESCSCKPQIAFPDGNTPEYFFNREEAIRAFLFAKQNKLYYGIHLGERSSNGPTFHILTVHIKSICPCKDCK